MIDEKYEWVRGVDGDVRFEIRLVVSNDEKLSEKILQKAHHSQFAPCIWEVIKCIRIWSINFGITEWRLMLESMLLGVSYVNKWRQNNKGQ